MAERWTCIFRKSINLNALLLQEKLPVQYCYFSYDPVTTIIYTAQIQPLAQFSTLRQSWFVVLLWLRSLWTLDVICKILCTPIFAKIALWSDEVALAIFGWKYNCEIELIYWERLFPSWFPSRHTKRMKQSHLESLKLMSVKTLRALHPQIIHNALPCQMFSILVLAHIAARAK